MTEEQPATDGGRRAVAWYVPLIGSFLMLLAAMMVILVTAAGIAAALWLTHRTASASSSEMRMVSGHPRVVVTNREGAGDVLVVVGGEGEVRLEANQSVRTLPWQRAELALAPEAVRIVQDGDEIMIEVTSGVNWPDLWFRRVDLVITVPPAADLDVDTGLGALEVRRLTGRVRAVVPLGSTHLSGVQLTGSSTLASGSGDIRFDGSLAPATTLHVENFAGNVRITLPVEAGTLLDAATEWSTIAVDGWSVRLERDGPSWTASGSLGVAETGSPATLRVRVTFGGIAIESRDSLSAISRA
jgi:hypothetical protein